MRKTFITISAAIAILSATSCVKEKMDPSFVEGTNICLMVDGKTIHTYDRETWQSSFKEKAIQYRVFSDDMKNYYTMVCDQKPTSTGQAVTASLHWATNGKDENKMDKLKFTVKKIDAETGAIWLWCKQKSIGVTILE